MGRRVHVLAVIRLLNLPISHLDSKTGHSGCLTLSVPAQVAQMATTRAPASLRLDVA